MKIVNISRKTKTKRLSPYIFFRLDKMAEVFFEIAHVKFNLFIFQLLEISGQISTNKPQQLV